MGKETRGGRVEIEEEAGSIANTTEEASRVVHRIQYKSEILGNSNHSTHIRYHEHSDTTMRTSKDET